MASCRVRLLWGFAFLLVTSHCLAQKQKQWVPKIQDLGVDLPLEDLDHFMLNEVGGPRELSPEIFFDEGGFGSETEVDAAIEVHLQNISKMADRIHFSGFHSNASFKSQDDFKPLGMEHLYFITNTFLKLIRREKEMPDELVTILKKKKNSDPIASVVNKLDPIWGSIVYHYIGIVSLVVLGLLIGVVVPITGFIFCCCRCGGRCGNSFPSYDKKGDPCRRVILGSLLATLIVILLLGLVCCFVSNVRMETSLETFPDEMNSAVSDVKQYKDKVLSEIQTLTDTNFGELQGVLFKKLDRSGILINAKLAKISKAAAIDNLTEIATSLVLIKKDLHIIRNVTIQLQEETAYLQSGLRDVASRLHEIRSQCEALHITSCLVLVDNYADKLEIRNNFHEYLETEVKPQLPNVQYKLDEVTRLIGNDIEIAVKRGKRAFDSIARDIQSQVQIFIPDIKQTVRDIRKNLVKSNDEFQVLSNVFDDEQAHDTIDNYNKIKVEYSMYRYWFFFLISSLLLLILFCFTMGLVFGCCGRRPDEATSCHKNTGASWLMWGTGLTFLFAVVIMISTTALFLIGSVGDIFICGPLQDPMNSDLFAIVEREMNLSKLFNTNDKIDIARMIRHCHYNESLYHVLEMKSIEEKMELLINYRVKFEVDKRKKNFTDLIGKRIDTDVQILSKEAKHQLRQLANTSLADKHSWHSYTSKIEQKVLPIDLLDLAAKLNETADLLPSVKLKNDALFLEGLRRWLSSIKMNLRILNVTSEHLSEILKFNKTGGLKEAIRDLISDAEFAQDYLQANGSKQILKLISDFSEDFLGDVDWYVGYVSDNLQKNVGACHPISAAYNATRTTVCKGIMNPFNGFWASSGWCFLFFLPCLIIAVKLASLYRKTEPYSGPLTDSHESMYDAFAERDNIPLTSGNDKKQCRRSREVGNPRIAGSYASEAYAAQPMAPPSNNYPPNSENT